MQLDDFHHSLASKEARGYPLNDEQRNAVDFGAGPLWLLAGPGSGKTEVLVTRTLKLICVDNIPPASIFVTTFTKKAALNLEDRLAAYMFVLQSRDTSLEDVDLADLRVGTIHSLCNDIMHEYRYPEYQNVRLLDDVEQHLFTYRTADIANEGDKDFWENFSYCFYYSTKDGNLNYTPNKWERTRAAINLFNHIVEDRVDLEKMRAADDHWQKLVEYYEQYEQALRDNYRCDFAHLQTRFLEFIQSDASQRLFQGDGDRHQPLRYILVDEYQDTNLIQERIYLTLAQNVPHNLTVVGDDDQALYRFRGGTVSCMVNFDKATQKVFGMEPEVIQLDKNYRSHRRIVDFFNYHITEFDEMQQDGVRAPGKQSITAASSINEDMEDYHSVNWLQTTKVGDLCVAVADFIEHHLLADNVINDLSQCVILMPSTKDSARNAGSFIDEFKKRDISVYNPRSKSFMESEEVMALLGGLVRVIDPNSRFELNRIRDLPGTIQSWMNTLDSLQDNPDYDLSQLNDYINKSTENLKSRYAEKQGKFLKLNLMEILYRLLSLEPFRTWKKQPERNMRLSKVTRLFESYHSLNLDTLRASDDGKELDPYFLERFYYTFVSYLMNAGIDDDEDEDVIFPRGYLPMMTIHQSKGLEFPFVIVANVGSKPRVGAAQHIEIDFAPFREELYSRTTRDVDTLATEDQIRLFYVAYSRAQYGLMIAATASHIKKKTSTAYPDFTHFRRTAFIPIISADKD